MHAQKCHNQTQSNARVSIIPGILRLRSHWLPTLATDAALLFLVMLSFILPSPVTLTVNALPAKCTVIEFSQPIKTTPQSSLIINCFTASTWHMLVGKLDVDDVISGFSGAVGNLTGAVLLVLCVDVHFTGPFNGEAQAAITYMDKTSQR